MTDRKGQIRDALGLLVTGLTGTRKEVVAKGEALAEDAIAQVKAHRRRLNAPAEELPTVEELEEDETP